ncbi:hypothetical protein HYW74_00295 [Candidatus Pacearchaeota archaeon]|nr:hypothetical protein [Candidatus Pacearchaeota archaeon]
MNYSARYHIEGFELKDNKLIPCERNEEYSFESADEVLAERMAKVHGMNLASQLIGGDFKLERFIKVEK